MATVSGGSWLECSCNGPHGGETSYIDVSDLSQEQRDAIAEWIESGRRITSEIREIIRPYCDDWSSVDAISNRGGWGVKDDEGRCVELFETEEQACAALES